MLKDTRKFQELDRISEDLKCPACNGVEYSLQRKLVKYHAAHPPVCIDTWRITCITCGKSMYMEVDEVVDSIQERVR